MSNPFAGAMYFISGIKLLNQPGIRRYVVIPLSINIVLFSVLLWFGAAYVSDFVDWIQASIPDWLDWIAWLVWPVFLVSAMLIGFFTFSLLANIIAAPFNSLLSTAIEKHLTGATVDAETTEAGFVASFIPEILNEVKKFGYFILWSVPFLILFAIPVVNVAAPGLWFIFSAWMLSLEYLDYPLSNRNLRFVDIKKRVRKQRLTALGFGSIINFALMIPIVNFIVMPAAVAGATVYAVERMGDEIN